MAWFWKRGGKNRINSLLKNVFLALMFKEKENGMPVFAGMTSFFIEKSLSTSAVTPAIKAGVPFDFCSFLMVFQQTAKPS